MSGYVVGLSIFLALAGCESMPQRAKEEATARWNRARAQVKASLAADHFAAGNVSAAAEELNEACRLDPTEPGLLPLRVRICLAEDRLSEAEALVEAGLRNGPPSAELEYLLGVIRQQEQRWDEALAAFKRAAELDAEEVAYVVATAQVWLQLGQPDAAQGYLESGAERFRWTNAYQAALAECHEQMGAWSAAASAWQRVIGSEAAGAALQERLAIALFRAGRYAEAAPVLDQLTSGPEASTAAALHLMLAESYLELGRDTAARTALQAVLRADRDDPRALRLLARALVVAGEDEAALATAQRVLLRQPEDVATLELVATLAWRAGNENVLVGALATLARCEPQSPVARVLRGEASSDVR
jgi:tetratricopeptide (TPR) repeat protein